MRAYALGAAAAALVILLVFAFTAAAQAHETTWRWNHQKAEYSLLSEGLTYLDGFHELYEARCYGYGPWQDGKPPQQHDRLFKHFRCRVVNWEDLDYWIQLHVTGKNTRVFRFVRFA